MVEKMKYKRYTDAAAFHGDVFDSIAGREVENNIPLRNIVRAVNGWDSSTWHFSTVSDGGRLLLVSVMTPPHNITICRTDACSDDKFESALGVLSDSLLSENTSVPGVTAPNETAERFAEMHTAATGRKYETYKDLRGYNLFRVNEGIERRGTVRPANENDLCFIPYWIAGFFGDTRLLNTSAGSLNDAYGNALFQLSNNDLCILEDGGRPVSMAGAMAVANRGRAVGHVYTPPFFRGNGYATSCVAAVSQRILDEGYECAILFTDLANPVSNSIYQKIGYEPVCDLKEIRFI